ncbi:unnamed protein product [Lampetra planeri]
MGTKPDTSPSTHTHHQAPGLLCVNSYNNLSCSSPRLPATQRTLALVVLISFSACTVVGNSLIVLSILYFRQLQTRTNAFTLSLALADMLVGLLVMPYSMMRAVYSCWFYGSFFCKVHTWFDFTFTSSSVIHLSCISIDRYIAISDPLRYPKRLGPPKVALMLVVCWSTTLAYGLPFFSGWTVLGIEEVIARGSCRDACPVVGNMAFAFTNAFFAYLIPLCIMVTSYAKIFRIAREQAHKIRANSAHVPGVESSSSSARQQWAAMKREHNATKTLGIIMGVFLLFWLPYCSVAVIDPIIGYQTSATSWDVANWIAYVNSAINPVLFASFNRSFRGAFRLIFTCRVSSSTYRNADLFNLNDSAN